MGDECARAHAMHLQQNLSSAFVHSIDKCFVSNVNSDDDETQSLRKSDLPTIDFAFSLDFFVPSNSRSFVNNILIFFLFIR